MTKNLSADKICALTFDDGPNTLTTVQVLDKLEKYSVTASFFIVGNNINSDTETVVKRAHSMGYEINNHSLTHTAMPQLSPEEIAAEINRTSEKILRITGQLPKFFRPPYIAVNNVMLNIIDLPFIAGIDAKDWEDSVSSDERAETIINTVTDGSIILLHDMYGNGKTVSALDKIISTLLKNGYSFVTMTELFNIKGITPQKGIIYSNVYQTTMYYQKGVS